jgi:hypothetical protein
MALAPALRFSARAALGCALSVACVAMAVAGCGRQRVEYGRSWGRQSAPPSEAYGWTTVQPPGAGFACRMPGRPEMSGGVGRSEDGSGYQSLRSRVTLPYGTFGVIVTSFEGGVVGDPLALARGLADRITQIGELTDRRARRLNMPGFFGREDVGHVDGGFVALRQFVGRDRLYVAVATVRNDPTGLHAAELFMDSIHVDRADALLPFGDSSGLVGLYMPEADFAVRMPPLTAQETRQLEIDGATVDAQVFESRHAGVTYRVSVVEFPDGAPDEALDEVASRLNLGQVAATAHASGFPGRAYRPADRGRTRAFVTEHRVYVLEARVTGQVPGDVATFLESFRIL